ENVFLENEANSGLFILSILSILSILHPLHPLHPLHLPSFSRSLSFLRLPVSCVGQQIPFSDSSSSFLCLFSACDRECFCPVVTPDLSWRRSSRGRANFLFIRSMRERKKEIRKK